MMLSTARRFQTLATTSRRRSNVLARQLHRSAVVAMPEIPFKLADIGEGIAEVEVLQWFIKEGDQIKQFQNVCEVQSDKATVEITSRYDGVIKKVHYTPGEMAKVGSTLIDIEVDDATAAAFQASGPTKKAAAPSPTRRTAPTPVAAPSQPAPKAPVAAVVNATAAPLQVVEVATNAPIVITRPSRDANDERVLTSPSVRRLAREHDIDLLDVVGTGPAGRLLKEDLLEHIRMLASQPKVELVQLTSTTQTQSSIPTTATRAATTASYLEQDTVVPLTPIQKMMVKSMTAALQVPHFNYADEIEMDALTQLRLELKPLAEQRGIKLSFMPFLIKAASLALKQFPSLNATVSEDAASVTYVAAHNISIAMDTPSGLIVPNVKNVQSKSVLEIAEDLNRLQQLASAGKLGVADLTGGTFSLSNIGSIGGTYMGPVIMVPQVAIGAVGKIQTLPRFAADGVSVKAVRVLNVSWSGDHRVIDGATMARFSNQWKQYIETPVAMLAEMS